MQKLTKKQRFILLLVLILGLSACNGIFPQNELIVTDNFEGVIFAQKDEDHWTPSRAEVLTLEERLGPYLQETAPRDYPGPLKNLSAYRRQYQGILVKGQRVIAVNFFCDAHGIDWRRQLVFITDGGSCYFEVEYDVKMGQFSGLNIHGEA